ncbi:fumarylacetoacetase [soil metagenome]
MNTWVDVPESSDFPVTNLPYGVFRNGNGRRIGVAIGEHVLDLAGAVERGMLDGPSAMLRTATLNDFMAAGREQWTRVRDRVSELLTDESCRGSVEPLLVPQRDVAMCLPFEMADYIDSYSSLDHATNVGKLFRPDAEPLLPNWRHLPVGYHGRAGTVVVSGTEIVRPAGQRKAPEAAAPSYGPSNRLDIEAEVGFVVGVPTALGERVSTADFAEHVFGVVLLNDWSARDIQAWEYVPLGPFLGKSFATSISPWVVPLAALAGARVPSPVQDPPPLDYLRDADPWALDLTLEVTWNGTVVSRPPFASTYWTPGQQLAHLTVNGASLRTGDLYASGTVSGPGRDQRGSFLELSWGGTEPVTLADGSRRTFLEDGDTVTIRATAPGPDGAAIGFGAVTGTIALAR